MPCSVFRCFKCISVFTLTGLSVLSLCLCDVFDGVCDSHGVCDCAPVYLHVTDTDRTEE